MKNRKGFTLVELLAVIVVIALVLGITIYGVTNIFKETKSKTIKLDESGVLKSAKIYAGEVPENSWIEDGQNKYFCVTIEELQNKGLIDKKAILEGNLVKTNYVMFTKDKITLVSDNGNISENSICTGNEEKEKITNYPKLKTGKSYTDTIELSYEPGEASSPITSTKCYYGTNTSLIEKEGIVSNNKCTIGKLKNNKSDYYVRVCQTTEKGSTICSKTENRKTEDFKSTTIKEENDNITITYNDENIIGTPGHYFMSSVPGTSATNVSSCTLNNDIFNCSETTEEIKSNQWYKTESSSIKINYSLTGKIKITTRITDSSHNYKEKNKDVTIYNTAYIYLKIDTDKEKIDSPTTYTDGSVYQWSTDNNGYITRSNAGGNTFSTYIQKYKHGITNTDLSNYNYSPYINISRKDNGYHVPSGEEWKCLSGCTTTGKTFGQSNGYKYKSTDFCDTSKGSCEVVLGVNWVKNITYSCPRGYSCTGGSCTASSKCSKTVTGEITEMYYCPHDGSYQKSSTCSYTGWEKAAMNLTCAKDGTTTCTASTYSCSSGSLSGTKCWKWSVTSCPEGWTWQSTGSCSFSCSYGNVLLYSTCSGTTTCSSSGAGYGCTSSCAGISDPNCRGGYTMRGGNYCHTTSTYYNCYKSATEVTHCSANKKYAGGGYGGCRVVGSDSVTNGFKCSSGGTNQYNDVGTDSCGVSGYTLTRTLDGSCDKSLKYDKEGKLYCNTSDYWEGKSCTESYTYGASAIYKLTCSKTGTKKYYCDADQTYYSSKPSSCTTTEYEDVIAS